LSFDFSEILSFFLALRWKNKLDRRVSCENIVSITLIPLPSNYLGGNPTVTVLNADTLTEEEMQKIAREMNLSETGFVLSSQKGDFRLRYFTPTREARNGMNQ
jgi:hypothetical protein